MAHGPEGAPQDAVSTLLGNSVLSHLCIADSKGEYGGAPTGRKGGRKWVDWAWTAGPCLQGLQFVPRAAENDR